MFQSLVEKMSETSIQDFGMSDISGVDLDTLNYKGKDAYQNEQTSEYFLNMN